SYSKDINSNYPFSGSYFFHPFWEKIDENASIKEAYEYACSYVQPGENKNVSEIQHLQLVDRWNIAPNYTFLPLPLPAVSHRYIDNGTYNVTLTVWDNNGNNATITKPIKVWNVPPVANFTWQPANPTDLDTVQFTSTSYDSDGVIVNYTWQFGDNTTAYGMNVTHLFANDGTYNVTLVITDDDGATATITKSIVISNIKPKALFTFSPKHPQEKKKIKFDASMSYDRDGNIVNYTWHFDDGTTAYGIVVYHKFAKKGVYDINLTVTDDDGATNSIISAIEVKEKEKTPGFEFAIIILAIAMLAIMRKRRIGIWRM
ncbi:MAG: hypothetical protein DRN11_03145, partial [Thermoplasmata archaeon]